MGMTPPYRLSEVETMPDSHATSLDEQMDGVELISSKQLEALVTCKPASVARLIKVATQGRSDAAMTQLELEEMRHVLTHGEIEAQVGFLFQMLDQDDDGLLTEPDLMFMLQLAADSSGLEMADTDMHAACCALLMSGGAGEDLSGKGLTLNEFSAVLEYRHVKTSLCPLSKLVFRPPKPEAPPDTSTQFRRWLIKIGGELKTNMQTPYGICSAVYIVAICSMFAWGWVQNVDSFVGRVMGPVFPVARGCAYMMRLNFALLLCTLLTQVLTWMRGTPFRYLLPFDQSISIHAMLGMVMGVAAIVHAFCLIAGFHIYASPSRTHMFIDAGMQQPSLGELYRMESVITGFILLGTLFIAYPFAMAPHMPLDKWPFKGTRVATILKSFTLFWHSHHLLWVVFVIILVIHPYPGLTTSFNSGITWMFICAPLLVFFWGRVDSHIRRRNSVTVMELMCAATLPAAGKWDVATRMLQPEDRPEGVTRLTLRRTKGRRFNFVAGQYCYLNIMSMGYDEWHPFTISSAPEDEFITLHVAVKGDWTRALYCMVHNARAVQVIQLLQGQELQTTTSLAFPASTDMGASLPPHVALEVTDPDAEGSSASTTFASDRSSLVHATMFAPEGQQASLVGRVETSLQSPRTGALVARQPSHGSHLPMQPMHLPINQLGDLKLTVRVDGPLGAPSQNYEDYEVLVCLAAGIGVTPMASILRHLVHQLGAKRCSNCNTVNINTDFWLKKLYFHWVVREQQAPHWFSETLIDICALDPCGLCELNIHLTSSGLNIGNVVLKLAQQAMQEATGVCLMTGLPSVGSVHTTFGRPDLSAIMNQVARAHPYSKVGVLFCGAHVMGVSLAEAVAKCGHPNITLHQEVF